MINLKLVKCTITMYNVQLQNNSEMEHIKRLPIYRYISPDYLEQQSSTSSSLIDHLGSLLLLNAGAVHLGPLSGVMQEKFLGITIVELGNIDVLKSHRLWAASFGFAI